ncbi:MULTISPECIES: NUDIX hydrolase [Methylobacterium]|uniref:NUDIX hydrolase n=1 Tax=Methylobacterium TaxID=407 RepID=UPI0013ECCA66|nr:NUDIX hydrolase [Methylobacterium sp. DB0501]NGM35798.1 NUDIX domain-containing protein [Methylobacterium sp. DB0501]
MQRWWGEPFSGAKLALIHDGAVVAYRRDEKAGIPFPGQWDLPGGGREGAESPEGCVSRELHEEFGLVLPASRLIWSRRYAARSDAGLCSFFFGAIGCGHEIDRIAFGSEGICWTMMPIDEFVSRQDAVPGLRARLADCVADLGGLGRITPPA